MGVKYEDLENIYKGMIKPKLKEVFYTRDGYFEHGGCRFVLIPIGGFAIHTIMLKSRNEKIKQLYFENENSYTDDIDIAVVFAKTCDNEDMVRDIKKKIITSIRASADFELHDPNSLEKVTGILPEYIFLLQSSSPSTEIYMDVFFSKNAELLINCHEDCNLSDYVKREAFRFVWQSACPKYYDKSSDFVNFERYFKISKRFTRAVFLLAEAGGIDIGKLHSFLDEINKMKGYVEFENTRTSIISAIKFFFSKNTDLITMLELSAVCPPTDREPYVVNFLGGGRANISKPVSVIIGLATIFCSAFLSSIY